MAMSEEKEREQKLAGTHSEQLQSSALVTSANIVLAKANYKVTYRIKGQGNVLYLSMGRTLELD